MVYAALFVIVLYTVMQLIGDGQTEKVNYSDVVGYFQNEQVKTFVISDKNVLKLEIRTEGDEILTVKYQLRDLALFYNDLGELILEQKKAGILTEFEYQPFSEMPFWAKMLPWILFIIIIIVLFFYATNKATGAGGAGKINSFASAVDAACARQGIRLRHKQNRNAIIPILLSAILLPPSKSGVCCPYPGTSPAKRSAG